MVHAILFAALFALPQSVPQASGAQRPPNVVYLMDDELGYYELSCLGNPNLSTPNIDRMAAEGMRFTQCLAGSALCAPTRACFLTGKHSGHTSVRTNGGGTPLRRDEVTIANLLHDRGYATGGFGKWGCGGRGSTGVPELHGFDVFVGYYDQVHAHSYFPAYLIENSKELPLAGNTGGRSGQTYSQYVIRDRAFEFIRAHAAGPFFCYLPFTPPHGLFDIPDDDPAWAMYRDKPWSMDARRYAAMVTMIDRQVGELFALLKELGIDGDTVVLFSGDNGGADYFADQGHPRGVHGANVDPKSGVEFRGKKGQLYEGGLRIPMICRWPGHVAPGTVSEHLCYFPDLLPTLAELCGAKVPADVDGRSFAPTLLGHAQQAPDHLYWELDGQTAVRAGDWKLIRTGPKQPWQLYDLATDVSEQHDLAGRRPEVVARLAATAAREHEPCVEGTFADRDLNEKDRRAKWGENAPQNEPAARAVHDMPAQGMLARDGWKVLRVSSESTFNGKLAANAIDGDPSTFWHTQWKERLAEGPHELVIDLGRCATVCGLCCLARQDNGWNGAIARCELSIADDPEHFGAPVATPTLAKRREAQTVEFAPVAGRYVRLRVLSEVGGGPWASLAEFGLLAAAPARAQGPPAAPQSAPLKKAFVDGEGWTPLTLADFVNVNGTADTWTEHDGVIVTTGKPLGGARLKRELKNFELVLEWCHHDYGGNSGVFVWCPESAFTDLPAGTLPRSGIEVQVLDLGYEEQWLKSKGKHSDWFTSHGDVFPVGSSTMTAFTPEITYRDADGNEFKVGNPKSSRCFPTQRLTLPQGQWNHYYVRAVNGEIRLWVNGVEVSGGHDCVPAQGYLALEAEGAHCEYRNLRIRELP